MRIGEDSPSKEFHAGIQHADERPNCHPAPKGEVLLCHVGQDDPGQLVREGQAPEDKEGQERRRVDDLRLGAEPSEKD